MLEFASRGLFKPFSILDFSDDIRIKYNYGMGGSRNGIWRGQPVMRNPPRPQARTPPRAHSDDELSTTLNRNLQKSYEKKAEEAIKVFFSRIKITYSSVVQAKILIMSSF